MPTPAIDKYSATAAGNPVAGEDVQQGGLSGSRRAHNSDELSGS